MEEIANHKDIPGNPSTAKSSKLSLNKRINGEPLNFLSSDQWDFWLENGYVIIKSAVSKNQAKKTASFLWEFEEKDPKNKDTWYTSPRAEMKMKELAGTGMVEVYNHQFLWENRQSEKISMKIDNGYEAFSARYLVVFPPKEGMKFSCKIVCIAFAWVSIPGVS